MLQESVETQVEKQLEGNSTIAAEPADTMDPSGPKLESEEPQDTGLEKGSLVFDLYVPITTYKFDDQN